MKQCLIPWPTVDGCFFSPTPTDVDGCFFRAFDIDGRCPKLNSYFYISVVSGNITIVIKPCTVLAKLTP